MIAKDASHRNAVFPQIARADLRATGRNSSNVESGKNSRERYRFNGLISSCDNDLENDGENGFDGRGKEFENTKIRIYVDLEDESVEKIRDYFTNLLILVRECSKEITCQ